MTTSIEPGRGPKWNWRRWGVFNLVGLLGFAVQLGALFVLKNFAGITYLAATAAAVELALLHNFVWHECVTWRDVVFPFRAGVALRVLRFHLANGIVSVVGNVIITSILVEKERYPYLLANGISVVICSFLNFFAGDGFVFRAPAQRPSSPIYRSLFLGVLFCSCAMQTLSAAQTLPQQELRTYALDRDCRAAEIAPDESAVAELITHVTPAAAPSLTKIKEVLQLWDFRSRQLLAEKVLSETDAEKRDASRNLKIERFVHFTADGAALIAIIPGNSVYVLDGHNLREVRRFLVDVPDTFQRSRWYKSQHLTIPEEPQLTFMEVSPVSHELSLVWIRGSNFARFETYDVDAGVKETAWNFADRQLPRLPDGLAWDRSGKSVYLAIPRFASNLSTNAPDIFRVSLAGEIVAASRTSLELGDIALTPGKIWAVDRAEVTILRNHAPKMQVLDVATGKQIKHLSGRGTGVRYSVASSRNGKRVVAFTGKVKAKFDWLDMVSYGVRVDSAFSVWNADDYSPVTVSQPLAKAGPLRFSGQTPSLQISAGGNFVICGTAIYELPR